MNSTDQKKLLKAGYTLIRRRTGVDTILFAKQGDRTEWFEFEKNFPSRAARDRRAEELLKKPNYVED